jgi:4-hydroxybenzoate polyprenyltransferase
MNTREQDTQVRLETPKVEPKVEAPQALAAANTIPLCVDLDGTLVHSDTLAEQVVAVIAKQPWLIFVLPFWLLSGRAAFKARIAILAPVNPQTLPYNEALLRYLGSAAAIGTPLLLVTAASRETAEAVARQLGIFERVISSSESQNLKSNTKRQALVDLFGERGFDYAGDSRADLEVWRSARRGVLAGAAVGLEDKVRSLGCEPIALFPRRNSMLEGMSRAIRVHQWSKNLLVFLPLLLAHKANLTELWRAANAFFAFSMVASAIYVLNDLFDIEADRRHPVKRNRPFASGDLPVVGAAALELVLLGAAARFVWLSGSTRLAWILSVYAALSIAYSLRLKHELLLDVMVLASLYTSRLLAGGAASSVPLSMWLLGFSIFLFLSMALIKRVSEIQRHAREGSGEARIRGYLIEDLDTITTIGVASGSTAALVIVLYMSGLEVRTLYQRPEFLWTISPVFLYWINQLWIKARRGQVQEDPILYCLKDKTTYLVGAVITLILLIASGSIASGYAW